MKIAPNSSSLLATIALSFGLFIQFSSNPALADQKRKVGSNQTSNSLSAIDPAIYAGPTKSMQTLLSDLVAADTTNPPGNEARAVAVGAARLKEAGIDYKIIEFAPGRQNLVARLKRNSGDGREQPLLLLAHIDVVSADKQPWSTPPHQLIQKGEYLYGRGLADDLGSAATALETLILLKKTNAKLKRDVILAWTGDEEAGGAGIKFLLKHHRSLIDAGVALNEGDFIRLDEYGKPLFAGMQVAEKIYQDFELITQGQTGHASIPVTDNAIYRLSKALDRVGQFQFPRRLIPVTRAYFKERAKIEQAPLSDAMKQLSESAGQESAKNSGFPPDALKVVETNPHLAALLRTTCVATQFNSGTNPNALPAKASANINCRILPDEKIQSVKEQLEKVIDDPQVEVQLAGKFGHGPASPLTGDTPEVIKKVIHEVFADIPIIPSMSTGATDSRYLRAAGIPAYGINPVPLDEGDARRFHGIDERIPKGSLKRGIEFFHRLVLALAGAPNQSLAETTNTSTSNSN